MKWEFVAVLFVFTSFPAVVTGRQLLFNEGSRFFISLDVREHVAPNLEFFATAMGVKAAWDLPDRIVDGKSNRRIRRSDLHRGIEELFNQYRMNGSACVDKFICEARRTTAVTDNDHLLSQLYRIMFSSKEEEEKEDDTWRKCIGSNWEMVSSACPLSLYESFPVSP